MTQIEVTDLFVILDRGKVVKITDTELNARVTLQTMGRGVLCKVLYSEISGFLSDKPIKKSE